MSCVLNSDDRLLLTVTISCLLCFIKRYREKEYVWWRCGKGWGKGVFLWAHAEASFPLRTSHRTLEYRIEFIHGMGRRAE